MEPFQRVTGVAAPLMLDNINTDAVIPVPWIVNFGRDLGQGLFGGWRYRLDGTENPDFILNRPPYREARILLAGRNFGCGSSREEAVWALLGFGIRAVVAASFGDIFFENSFKNGLLPVALDLREVTALAEAVQAGGSPQLTVDLQACTVEAAGGPRFRFTVQDSRRQALLRGLDEVGITLTHGDRIDAFQAADRARRPWIYAAGPAARPARPA
jgi:3-isopropylmalate/(R)-2-methylmalate dehydratase small subunit